MIYIFVQPLISAEWENVDHKLKFGNSFYSVNPKKMNVEHEVKSDLVVVVAV